MSHLQAVLWLVQGLVDVALLLGICWHTHGLPDRRLDRWPR